ncbi:MAG: hypoxanthine phosphoribosyltransferase [Deltaproteobacteria bacterium]|nr:hypoxanthine phosphoribosyltransferase [Deltaproteobacteria bacterium]MBI3295192.1 hypoxanthine phosphoribosyltransferase [Deltaproteobacteria bacterium]
MGDDKLTLFLSADEIHQLNVQLGKTITQTCQKNGIESLLCVVTLKGAIFFAADLIRHIPIPLKIDFIRLSSYGAGTSSSGTVRVVKDLETSIEGQHVLILDEIVDSGRTIAFLIEKVSNLAPKSVRVATLLSKPSRREVPVQIDFCGKEIDDTFVVGYGLDYNERYRELKDIYSVVT